MLTEPSNAAERASASDDDQVRADRLGCRDDLPCGIAARLEVARREVAPEELLTCKLHRLAGPGAGPAHMDDRQARAVSHEIDRGVESTLRDLRAVEGDQDLLRARGHVRTGCAAVELPPSGKGRGPRRRTTDRARGVRCSPQREIGAPTDAATLPVADHCPSDQGRRVPTIGPQSVDKREAEGARVDLYWLPLGAGGHSVRLNGRIFEAGAALLEHRERRDLYHSALVVEVPDGRFVIEQGPSGRGDPTQRGVVAEGPVGARRAGSAPSLPIRGSTLAERRDSGHRRGSRQPSASQHGSGVRASAARVRTEGANACVGPRRASRGRDVELELADLVAGRAQRCRRRSDSAARRRPRARLAVGRRVARRQAGEWSRSRHAASLHISDVVDWRRRYMR